MTRVEPTIRLRGLMRVNSHGASMNPISFSAEPDECLLQLNLGIDTGETCLGRLDIGRGLGKACAEIPVVNPEQDVSHLDGGSTGP